MTIKYHENSRELQRAYLQDVQEMLSNFTPLLEYDNLNKVLELENISLFLDNDTYHEIWVDKGIEDYQLKNQQIKKIINKFFNKIDNDNIYEIVSDIDAIYIDNFWYLFNSNKLCEKVSNQNFKKILKLEKIHLREILKYKDVIMQYKTTIKDYIFSNQDAFEVIMDIEFNEDKKNSFKVSLLELIEEEITELIHNYITEDFNKIKYIEKIIHTPKILNKEISIPEKIRAKEIYDKLVDKCLQKGRSIGYEITYNENQQEEVVCKTEEDGNELLYKIYYSLDWLEKYLDYPTILNNFIHIFEFVDFQCRISSVSREHEVGVFEKCLLPQGKNHYTNGVAFQQKNLKIEIDLMTYYEFLKSKGIRLEEVLEWFFMEYLNDEFNIQGFTLSLPSEGLSYVEKCKCIMAEIESVLKQFDLFCKYKQISREMLAYVSTQLKFENVKSLIPDKYIYIDETNPKIVNILTLLFSNQSLLSYVNGIEDQYDSFYKLIVKEKVSKQIFEEYQVPSIDFLLQNEILYETDEGILKFKNYKMIFILRELYMMDAVCSSYRLKFKKELDLLKNNKMIKEESTLLAKNEAKYLNYVLNARLANGMQLRNIYGHGTNTLDEKRNKEIYFKFLEVLIYLVIKINEEFCLVNPER